MVKLLSYLRECIDLANGHTRKTRNTGITRKKAKQEAGYIVAKLIDKLIRCEKATGS